jgi:sarcosine oxidase subunit beta
MPADGLPILGECPEVGGFFNAVMHSGVTLSAIVGLLMAQLITEGEAEIPLEPYSLHRFQH